MFLFVLFYSMFEELQRTHNRHLLERKKRRMLRTKFIRFYRRRFEADIKYCRLNLHVPVLEKFFDGGDTKADFRLTRESLNKLLELLHQQRRHGWGTTLQTLVFLYWLACGASYRVVSQAFGMPRPTIHRIIHRVADEVIAILPKVVALPKTEEHLIQVGAGFASLTNHQAFGRAVGAIDGCHVRIKPPAGPDEQCYKNRKLFASILLQGICDHQGAFLDIFVGYPGSVHDSRVLKNSPIYNQAKYPPQGFFLLGDGGYPCTEKPIAIMTPFKNPASPSTQRFNARLSKGRSIIERAFGMMKTRFRAIFLQALEVHPTFAPKVIASCTMLHNICLGVGDIIQPDDSQEEEEDDVEACNQVEAVSGAAWRLRLCNQVSALQDVNQDHDYIIHPN
ncbi:putative nuclease HARBI1 [Carassius gibelio]|uniref:putative nuclease HARBI1 n=2 Tax=Carassius gibelio TaxID=101364 RepID=UPI0022793D71|nr:putative nuclease HARBI1 [Carassius gibelio]